jgi:hypothetical protein
LREVRTQIVVGIYSPYTRRRARSIEINCLKDGMRDRTPYKHGGQGIVSLDIVEEPAGSAEKRSIF